MVVLVTNKQFSQTSEAFKRACSIADIPSTVRQASKYRMQKGSAYPYRNAAQEAEAKDIHLELNAIIAKLKQEVAS